MIGQLNSQMIHHGLSSWAMAAGVTLHVDVIRGRMIIIGRRVRLRRWLRLVGWRAVGWWGGGGGGEYEGCALGGNRLLS